MLFFIRNLQFDYDFESFFAQNDEETEFFYDIEITTELTCETVEAQGSDGAFVADQGVKCEAEVDLWL